MSWAGIGETQWDNVPQERQEAPSPKEIRIRELEKEKQELWDKVRDLTAKVQDLKCRNNELIEELAIQKGEKE